MRSTLPLSPHFTDPDERKILARVLRHARRQVMASPARTALWARGYHVRLVAAYGLGGELADRMWAAPLWRGRPTPTWEMLELSSDGPS
jgi:hypothetical protein